MNELLDGVAVTALIRLSKTLNLNELDSLKYRLSIVGAAELENLFEISQVSEKSERLSTALKCLWQIQPFWMRVPEYGIVYHGRPEFVTDKLLDVLRTEASDFRASARLNFDQFIARVETPFGSTFCEKLAASDDLHTLVSRYAGPCERSYITSYIYYDEIGHCSRPHVDNAFTSITAMMNLRNEHEADAVTRSTSIFFWPNSPARRLSLEPGELVIFFGVCGLHGRTPVGDGETVHSLLMSFRPTNPVGYCDSDKQT